MKEYALNEEIGFGSLDFEWIVYDYEECHYDGHGEAVALGKDGKLYFHDMGHCSCFGPFDEFPNGGSMSVEDFLLQGEVVTDTTKDNVRQKVEELLKV